MTSSHFKTIKVKWKEDRPTAMDGILTTYVIIFEPKTKPDRVSS